VRKRQGERETGEERDRGREKGKRERESDRGSRETGVVR